MCNRFSKNLRLGAGAPAIGIPFFWSSAAMPNTVMDEWSDMVFLKANGSSFSAATYPKLAKVWTGLVIPDMRGEFPRLWDDGRGVDAGRALLSSQGDAIRNITGTLNLRPGSSDNLVTYATGALKISSRPQSFVVTNLSTATKNAEGVDFDASGSPGVVIASENRPRNIAFSFLVRAK
ncbi:TPA: phage tail protein [Citrobacter farmeri]